MKFVNLKISQPKESVISMITDNKRVNENVRFEEKRGVPHMHVKIKKNGIRIKCEMMNRPTKDNGFFVGGTVFLGSIREKDGITKLSGIALTSPVYHVVMITLMIIDMLRAVQMGGFSLLPIFVVAFEIIFFKDEFRKQGYIARYLERAFRRLL